MIGKFELAILDCLYRALLRRMAPEHKFATMAKLCQEVLGGAADGTLPLEEAEEVLCDSLRILASKHIKVCISPVMNPPKYTNVKVLVLQHKFFVEDAENIDGKLVVGNWVVTLHPDQLHPFPQTLTLSATGERGACGSPRGGGECSGGCGRCQGAAGERHHAQTGRGGRGAHRHPAQAHSGGTPAPTAGRAARLHPRHALRPPRTGPILVWRRGLYWISQTFVTFSGSRLNSKFVFGRF